MGTSHQHEYSKVSEAKWGICVILVKEGEVEGEQSFATSKYAFLDIDFKMVFKKQMTQGKPLTSPQILDFLYICNKFRTFSPVNWIISLARRI